MEPKPSQRVNFRPWYRSCNSYGMRSKNALRLPGWIYILTRSMYTVIGNAERRTHRPIRGYGGSFGTLSLMSNQ